jgi:hypothetical protein
LSDRQRCFRRTLNRVFVADSGGLGVLMSNHLIEPITQAVVRPFRADLAAVSFAHQARVEQPGIGIDLIPDDTATVSLIWEESAPPACIVGIGTANLIVRDAQFLHSLSDNQVEVLGIAFGEIPGVRCRVEPQGPLGGRRADHRRPTQPQFGDKRPYHSLDAGQEIVQRGHAETIPEKTGDLQGFPRWTTSSTFPLIVSATGCPVCFNRRRNSRVFRLKSVREWIS